MIERMTHYREVADMPEIKVKKEWYCTLDPHNNDKEGIVTTMGPVWITGIVALLWAAGLAVFNPDDLLSWAWVRYLAVIFVYMLVWSAIFMRRREVKE